MNKVLMTAVIVLPLVMFLAFFGDNIIDNFRGNADDTAAQTQDMDDNAAAGAWDQTD